MRQRVKFYLKSGAVLSFKAKTVTVKKNNNSGAITEIVWNGADRIVVAAVDDIAAVEVH
jgi:hypothetical protein